EPFQIHFIKQLSKREDNIKYVRQTLSGWNIGQSKVSVQTKSAFYEKANRNKQICANELNISQYVL
ncbi:hypothetical protein, partial [Neglectibacter timonensis]|uniref:hypothetical protein n=1 Tax=Neglectibacter timonensis TaxID=1776382 RepID=UPI00248D56AA